MSGRPGLLVDSGLSIPRHELAFRASRSGGPGGQHVNTSSTRVELLWNLDSSTAVSDEQRTRLRARLGGKVDTAGNIRVVASAFRSQLRNKEEAERRLAILLRRALAIPKARKRTRPTGQSVERRLESKRRLAEKKRARRLGSLDE
ncbi:MAG TPA: alternative ribosome rescue aminoacyl-tRNA hydrolase ArfB [Gemmatimonadaceae bacterium]|nr:alternative ribosome rescue aminoacyl-tRNA hydrolase ArfB [Gemmatimonadaceae bacterium]